MAYKGTPYKLTIDEKAVARSRLMVSQDYKCPLCGTSLRSTQRGGAVLDHCHTHGHIRATLCRVCNTGEGVVKTAAIRYGRGTKNHVEWLRNLADYLEKHKTPQSRYIYPVAKTKAKRRRRIK